MSVLLYGHAVLAEILQYLIFETHFQTNIRRGKGQTRMVNNPQNIESNPTKAASVQILCRQYIANLTNIETWNGEQKSNKTSLTNIYIILCDNYKHYC